MTSGSPGFRLPLTPTQFRDAIHAGLGRAILHVRAHGTAGLEPAIIESSVRNTAYDPQCEPDRAEWILALLDEGRCAALVAPHILEAIATSSNTWDLDLLSSLAAALVHRGIPEARPSLYRAFDNQAVRSEWVGGGQIIRLDGADGFLHVARRIGARARAEPGYSVDAYLSVIADETLGEGVARRLLEAVSPEDLDLIAFREALYGNTQRFTTNIQSLPAILAPDAGLRVARREERLAATPFADVYRDIVAPGFEYLAQPGILREWGSHAAVSELRLAAEALFTATDNRTLIRLLQIFGKRGIPGFDSRLLSLLDHADADVCHRAAYAFGATRHQVIRALALERTRPGTISGGVLQLFTSNLEPGDGNLIMSALPMEGEREVLHSLAFPLSHIWQHHPTPDAARPLTWVYDLSSCSNCRYAALKTLHQLGAVPLWARDEAPFDCHNGIRELLAGTRAGG